MSAKNLIIAVLCGAALAAGFLFLMKPTEPAPLRSGIVLPTRNALTNINLLSHTGDTVTDATFRGQWDLLFFGFTHCPDICPTTLQTLATAQKQLRESGASPIPRIVLVSVDPERDNTDKLRQYLAYFGGDHLGITGSLQNIRQLTSDLGIYFARPDTTDDNYSVDHSSAVLLINEDGEFHALFGGPHSVADLVHDLPLIVGNR